MFGFFWGWFTALVYLVSFVNLLRILHLCGFTEPGIIPQIRSKKIDYNKQYRVQFRDPGDILADFKDENEREMTDREKALAFFSIKQFKLIDPAT